MSFIDAIKNGLRQYATFRGRASRPEFWWFMLFCALIVSVAEWAVGEGFSGLLTLALTLPTLAIIARRLHDVGRSAWWMLLLALPPIGQLVTLYWFVQPSMPQANKYDPIPDDIGM